MFVPKWLLFILFTVSIGSIIALLLVLSSKPGQLTATPAPTMVVQVSSSPANTSVPSPSASPSAMPAAADWSKHKNTDISVSLDYPTSWTVKADAAKNILIGNNKDVVESSDSAVGKESIRIYISREKKVKSSYSLADYKKANTENIKSEATIKMDGFDGIDRVMTRQDGSTERLIVFLTKNYVYTVVVTPSDSSLKPVADELLKSIEII
jgi:hypothetical protein